MTSLRKCRHKEEMLNEWRRDRGSKLLEPRIDTVSSSGRWFVHLINNSNGTLLCPGMVCHPSPSQPYTTLLYPSLNRHALSQPASSPKAHSLYLLILSIHLSVLVLFISFQFFSFHSSFLTSSSSPSWFPWWRNV